MTYDLFIGDTISSPVISLRPISELCFINRLTDHNVKSEKPSVLQKEDTFVTIVATINCMDSGAKPLFKTLGIAEQQYIYAADSFI